MNRTTPKPTVTATEARPGARPVAGRPVASAGADAQHVCPFCGSLNADSSKPCPRCTLEDTPATRQATRARIGPWYVLQNRNPAAPGMKLQTLQSLVQKGFVTPRSIVRGPTTHQLWRLAALVKGLSREFGLCYSCGNSIETTASLCPHCNRSQSPPTESDSLVERPPAASAPVEAPAPATAQPASHASANPPVKPIAPTVAPPPPTAVNQPTPPPPQPRQQPPPSAPDPVIAEHSDREPGMPDLLTAPDVAKAFHLFYDEPAARRRRRLGWRTKLMIAGFLLLCAAGAAFYFLPSINESVMKWLHAAAPAGTRSDQTTSVARLASERLPPATTAPTTAPAVVFTPALEAAGEAADIAAASDSSAAEARRLWSEGLVAESHRDFKSAVAAYERLESLPSSVWPKGLHTRRQLARQEIRSGLR